jgi:hypothetical protein
MSTWGIFIWGIDLSAIGPYANDPEDPIRNQLVEYLGLDEFVPRFGSLILFLSI